MPTVPSGSVICAAGRENLSPVAPLERLGPGSGRGVWLVILCRIRYCCVRTEQPDSLAEAARVGIFAPAMPLVQQASIANGPGCVLPGGRPRTRTCLFPVVPFQTRVGNIFGQTPGQAGPAPLLGLVAGLGREFPPFHARGPCGVRHQYGGHRPYRRGPEGQLLHLQGYPPGESTARSIFRIGKSPPTAGTSPGR